MQFRLLKHNSGIFPLSTDGGARLICLPTVMRNNKAISRRATGTSLLGPLEGQCAPAECPVFHVHGNVQLEISEPGLLELLQRLVQVTQLRDRP